MEARDILTWCFTVAALTFGVFGFLYSTYAGAMLQTAAVPPITRDLRRFCWALAFVLVVLTGLAAFTSYRAEVGFSTWLIVCCFVALMIFTVGLAYKME